MATLRKPEPQRWLWPSPNKPTDLNQTQRVAGVDGSVALHVVAANREASPELLQKLIVAGSDVNAKKLDGSTALHIVAAKMLNLRKLIAARSDVNAEKEDGSTVLRMVEAKQGASPELLQELIAADLHQR